MPLVYIGIGTNLGNRHTNIRRAFDLLTSHKKIKIIKTSSISETEPVDFLEQPVFLNQIILLETSLDPSELMIFLQNIESGMGRKKIIPKGPRIIDLDILLYDDLKVSNPDLIIPHPGIKNRQFILKHLIELNPGLRDPVTGMEYIKYYKQ
jgi:2-amino-4-hydroxy-6-hydroxymethyldihydropteridine diphosphokinase